MLERGRCVSGSPHCNHHIIQHSQNFLRYKIRDKLMTWDDGLKMCATATAAPCRRSQPTAFAKRAHQRCERWRCPIVIQFRTALPTVSSLSLSLGVSHVFHSNKATSLKAILVRRPLLYLIYYKYRPNNINIAALRITFANSHYRWLNGSHGSLVCVQFACSRTRTAVH